MSECDDQRVPVACSLCFSDRGLYLDAERNGMAVKTPFPNCGSPNGKQLDADALEKIAHNFLYGARCNVLNLVWRRELCSTNTRRLPLKSHPGFCGMVARSSAEV